MRFENRARIPASREAFWAFVMNIEQVAACIPGVEEVRHLGGDEYAGTMRVRVGPVALRLEGKATVTERDQGDWRAALKGEATDRRTAGAVRASMVMRLEAVGDSETELVVTTDASVLGRIGEFGQPVMRKKAESIMAEFAGNVSQRVQPQQRPA